MILDVDDGYNGLPAKTRAICQWAMERDYDYIFKTDDDCYVQVERLLQAVPSGHDYVGRVRGPSGIFPAPYCSGLGYWISAKAAQIIAKAEMNGDQAEDRWVGNVLLANGVAAYPDYRYAVLSSLKNAPSAKEGPRQGNSRIAVCEFTPEVMHEVHRQWLEVPSGIPAPTLHSGKLSRVAILIKTFLRDGLLSRALRDLEQTIPEAKLVIVDDGYEQPFKITKYAELREQGHSCTWLPFDSGFGAKANAGLPFCDREYILIGSDDFVYDKSAREAIEKMAAVLDADPSVHIVSGRLNGRIYESCLEINCTSVREIPGHREARKIGDIAYHICDLTVNFSLIRRECLGPDKLHWDGGETKIGGGEHGAFFLDARRLGYQVAVVPEAVIQEMQQDFSQVHPMYPQMRRRASQPGRACLRARGIERWGLQDGTWETC